MADVDWQVPAGGGPPTGLPSVTAEAPLAEPQLAGVVAPDGQPPIAGDARKARPNNVTIGLLAGVIVVLIGVGIFGFTRPPSDEAKKQGDALAGQVSTMNDTTRSLNTVVTDIRTTVSELDTLDSRETDAGNEMLFALADAEHSWNAGDTTAFQNPALVRAIADLKAITDEESRRLTDLQNAIAKAQEAK